MASKACDQPPRERRFKMFHPAEMRIFDMRVKIHVLNISRSGLLISTETPPPSGANAIFDLGTSERRGRIVWVAGDRCGVQFHVPIEAAELSQLIGGGAPDIADHPTLRRPLTRIRQLVAERR